MKSNIYTLNRFREIIFVLVKYGFGDLIESLGFPTFSYKKKKPSFSRNERILKAIEELGPTFIKLAQFLSIRPDLISVDLAKELEKLQDKVTPIEFKEIEKVLIEELGDYKQIFVEDFKLLASASIAQVYKSRLASGEEVAIKILKPNIEDKILADIALLDTLANMFNDKFLTYGIDLKEIINEFSKNIKKELNLKLEAINLQRFYKNFENDKDVKIPKLYKTYSSVRVLTMEFIEGIKISNKEALIKSNVDIKKVIKIGFKAFLDQIFVFRFFHADPHPGNIWVSENKIVFLDFGLVGSLSKEDVKNFAYAVYYFVKGKGEKAAYFILKLSKVKNENLDEDAFKKDIEDILNSYFTLSLEEIDLNLLLDDIMHIMSKHKVYFKENNYLLAKALITIEGVGKSLYPEFRAFEEIKPYIKKIYRKIIFSTYEDLNDSIKHFLDMFTSWPATTNNILNKLDKGRFKMELIHVGLDSFEDSIQKSFNILSISIILASILMGSSMLLSSKIPPLIGEVSVFGIAGFIFSILVGIILIINFLRKK